MKQRREKRQQRKTEKVNTELQEVFIEHATEVSRVHTKEIKQPSNLPTLLEN